MQLLTPSIRKLSALALGVTLALGPVSAHAQNLFAPVLRINDSVVTAYELEQRARMLSVLRAPGNPSELAREHTVLLSTHYLGEVEAVCQRFIIINRGRVAAEGRLDDLRRQTHIELEAVGPKDKIEKAVLDIEGVTDIK
ncbi:MAG: hypothetical protein NWQ37_09035, partial [Marivita lacus]|nr:hypothetical protein [Marivita lacus]